MRTKRCSRCGQDLPASEYHTDLRPDYLAKGWRDDGLTSWCKRCRASWVASRKDDVSRYNAEYYRRNRDRRINQVHEYQRQHPEAKRVAANRRRARTNGSSGRHSAQDLRDIYAQQEGRCYYCAVGPISRRAGHFDHVVPLSRGGSNGPENIVFACEPCNRAKHTRTLEEFLAWRLQQTNANRSGDAEPSNATFGSSSDASEKLR